MASRVGVQQIDWTILQTPCGDASHEVCATHVEATFQPACADLSEAGVPEPALLHLLCFGEQNWSPKQKLWDAFLATSDPTASGNKTTTCPTKTATADPYIDLYNDGLQEYVGERIHGCFETRGRPTILNPFSFAVDGGVVVAQIFQNQPFVANLVSGRSSSHLMDYLILRRGELDPLNKMQLSTVSTVPEL